MSRLAHPISQSLPYLLRTVPGAWLRSRHPWRAARRAAPPEVGAACPDSPTRYHNLCHIYSEPSLVRGSGLAVRGEPLVGLRLLRSAQHVPTRPPDITIFAIF